MCDVCAAHEEFVAASKQFRRSRGEKSTRLGLVALTVGPVHIRRRASKERASEGSVCGEGYVLLQLKREEYRRLRVKERKRRSVLQSARADGDGMSIFYFEPLGLILTLVGSYWHLTEWPSLIPREDLLKLFII